MYHLILTSLLFLAIACRYTDTKSQHHLATLTHTQVFSSLRLFLVGIEHLFLHFGPDLVLLAAPQPSQCNESSRDNDRYVESYRDR